MADDTAVIVVDAEAPDRARVRRAAAVLRAGGLVAFPTETVYGLGANALDAGAVARIFQAKGRPSTDPVIVHLASVEDLTHVAVEVPSMVNALAAAFWPGPLTLIVRKAAAVPPGVTAGLDTVGVRVPSHPVARMLIEEAGVPVAAPSANRFSRPSPTRAAHVLADLAGRIDMVLDAGLTPIGLESTILDLTHDPPLVRRPGGVSLAELKRVVADVRTLGAAATGETAQRAPGQLLRHYAPKAQLTLYVGNVDAVAERVSSDARAAVASGQRVGVLAPEEDLRAMAPRLAAVGSTGRVITQRCGSRADREEIARVLFDALRTLDATDVDLILAIAASGHDMDDAIVDRLTRAAEGRVVRLW